MMADSSPAFHCEVCMTDICSKEPSIDIVGHPACRKCVMDGLVPLFQAALVNEQKYPPKWGDVLTPIDDFLGKDVFSLLFMMQWAEKILEWDVLPKDRVYCANNACTSRSFLGSTTTEKQSSGSCEHCKVHTCLCCRISLTKDDEEWTKHICDHSKQTLDVAYQLPDSSRGKDWQLCPNQRCSAVITLIDGCNHVQCAVPACKTDFCFRCGNILGNGQLGGHFCQGPGQWRQGVLDEGLGNQGRGVEDNDWETVTVSPRYRNRAARRTKIDRGVV